MPHLAADPVPVACEIVMALQTLVTRSVSVFEPGVVTVTLATAHPAKFPDAVERATGVRPDLPEHLSDLLERRERYDTIPNELAAIEHYVENTFIG